MKRILLLSGVGILVAGLILTLIGALSGGGQGKIQLTLINKPTVMTAAYKVYGDAEAVDGKYWLSKLTLKNDGDGSLHNVRISYQVPEYIAWTTPQRYAEILPGQTIVSTFYPRFPASVTKITSLTPTSIELKIEYEDDKGEQTRVERRDFKFRGVQEIEYSSLPPSEILTWYDANDNAELNTAWVTENDPVVRAYYAKISETSGGFGTMSNAKEITQLAKSVYNFMVATGMTYSGTAGVAEQRGDGWVLVQDMRLPRDVIYGNSGLCVELAQLWASIAVNAGAKCYLVFIPGHCFPVIQTSEFGDGTMLPVEATGIGGAFQGGNLGKGMSFEDAVKVATQNLMKVRNGQTPGMIIDIGTFRNQGIRPPELASIDQAAFVKMLDDRIKKHQETTVVRQDKPVSPPVVRGDTPGQGGAGPVAGGVPWADPNGRLSLAYPSTWFQNPQAIQNLRGVFPGYALSVVDPTTRCGLDVIFFNGAQSADSVARHIESTFRNMGMSVTVGAGKPANFAGVNGTMFPLNIQSPNGVLASVMSVVPVKGGMAAVNFGGPLEGFQASQQVMGAIVQSLRIVH